MFRYEGDEARLFGGEISFGYTPTDKLSLGMGVDYVNGKRLANGDEYLPFMPPLRFMANAEYDFGSFWIGARVQLVSKQDRVAPEEDITDGYTLLGAQAGYRLDRWGRHVIILRGENLLDKAYRDHLSRIEVRNISMPGRNINLAYRWYF